MFNRSFHNLFMESMILATTLLASTSAYAEGRNLVTLTGTNSSKTSIAQTPQIPAINNDDSLQQTNNMSQVTSVSLFSDVQPTDWAFGALQSLVERYGCIAGYPNSTYRGGNPAPANDLSLHIEGFYKYQLTDNIAITPGVIWLTAPAQNKDNQDAVIGTVRTTFTF